MGIEQDPLALIPNDEKTYHDNNSRNDLHDAPKLDNDEERDGV